jgi:hypothetical protein
LVDLINACFLTLLLLAKLIFRLLRVYLAKEPHVLLIHFNLKIIKLLSSPTHIYRITPLININKTANTKTLFIPHPNSYQTIHHHPLILFYTSPFPNNILSIGKTSFCTKNHPFHQIIAKMTTSNQNSTANIYLLLELSHQTISFFTFISSFSMNIPTEKYNSHCECPSTSVCFGSVFEIKKGTEAAFCFFGRTGLYQVKEGRWGLKGEKVIHRQC